MDLVKQVHLHCITLYAEDVIFDLVGMYFILQSTNLHETNVSCSKLMLDTFTIIIMNTEVKIPNHNFLVMGIYIEIFFA